MDTERSHSRRMGSSPAVASAVEFFRPPRLSWMLSVVWVVSLQATRARALQLDECPVGCSSHGSCRDGLCACAAGWTGQDCSYFLADGASNEDGPVDEDEECVDDCSSHGSCSGGVCQCRTGWSGLSCNIAAECPTSCRPPSGNCNAGTCVCMAGFFGPDCADALCPSNCFGHGVCNRGACVCSEGWFGRLCDSHLDEASMCDPPCSSNGQCVSGQCFCSSGFTGVDCSLQVEPSQTQTSGLIMTGSAQEHGIVRSLQTPEIPSVPAVQRVERRETPPAAPAPPPAPVVVEERHSNRQIGAAMAQQVHQFEEEVHAPWPHQRTMPSPTHPSMMQFHVNSAPPPGVMPPPSGISAGVMPPPSGISAGLDAVFKATRAAGSAAERLRETAQKEFAQAAKHRIDVAMDHAHQHAKSLPGYQEAVQPAVVHPVVQPVLQTPVVIPRIPLVPPSIHSAAAEDDDHEDSIELSEQSDDSHTAMRDFQSKVNALQDFRSHLVPTHSLMVSSARQAPAPKCEADCSGHGTCVLFGRGAACQCSPGFVGMLCDIPRCPHDCNGRGTCVQGKCLCGKGFVGSACGDTRCPDDCSGVGYCLDGKCNCKTGYDGHNCAKIKPAGLSVSVKMMPLAMVKAPPPIQPYHEGLTLRAIPPKVCPDDCSGNGYCRSNGECQCNVGYSGQACEMFCPNECSHNGDCIEGSCLCFAGFLGVDCSITGCCSGHGTCDDPGTCVCNKGWGGDDCSLKLMCADPACSGHGTCSDGKCNCVTGFSGAVCAIQDGGCVPPCGPNGACNPLSKKCECAGGAAGPTCLAAVSSCPSNCNNRGLCMNGECMCGPGWMGSDCSKKYFAPGQKPPPAAEAKGGAGKAAARGGGMLASIVALGGPPPAGATADDGAAADDSEDPNGMMQLNPNDKPKPKPKKMVLGKATGGVVCGDGGFCSGHGTCNTELAKCDCEASFYGEVCEMQHCPGFDESGQDCFGHGMCNMGKCECAPGWGLPLNLIGPPKPESCKYEICPVGCGDHGKCFNGKCICQQGWQGPNCKDPQCPNDCAGHGQCAFQSPHSPGQCICNYGWGGAGCQRVAVYTQLARCPNDCSGQGLCMNGMCACNVGFSGNDCSELVCSGTMSGPNCDQLRCPSDCNGRGLCMNGMCACWSAYTGASCMMPVMCQESCDRICSKPGFEERCTSCIGMCESSAPKSASGKSPALGVHNPYEDLQSTFLQENYTARPGHTHHSSDAIKHNGRSSMIAIAVNSTGNHQRSRHKETTAIVMNTSHSQQARHIQVLKGKANSSHARQRTHHVEKTSVIVNSSHGHHHPHHTEKAAVIVNASHIQVDGHHAKKKKHRHHESSVSLVQYPNQHTHPHVAHHHMEISALQIQPGLHASRL